MASSSSSIAGGPPPSFPLLDPPRLRPVEVIPVGDAGDVRVWLRDPADPEITPIGLSQAAVQLLALLDGKRTVADIEDAVARQQPEARGVVRDLFQRLDEAGYLEGPRARDRLTRRQKQFRELAARPAIHAGGAYPDGARLPDFLAAGYLDAAGPGSLPGKRSADASFVRGAIAPHIDLHRGSATYSWVYRALAECQPADLYVILGTSHAGVDGTFAATLKPYDTPLGPVPADAAFLTRLGQIWGRDLYRGEFAHAGEHSIEFQAVYLRSVGLAGDSAASIAPILCDSLHNLVLPPHSPRDVAVVSDFVRALRQAIREDGRKICVIAAVDFAHIGPRFGDDWPADAPHLQGVRRDDEEMLHLILQKDPLGYYSHVMRDNDARRICGFTPLYLLTELMSEERIEGELLRYSQWAAPDASSSVTFGAAIFADRRESVSQ